MNEKQQQLTFEKGITCIPSDAICSDNALSQCTGMTYNDGEMRPIQKPAQVDDVILPDGSTLVYVHRTNNTVRYIFTVLEGGVTKVKWTNSQSYHEITQCSGEISISSVGNILVMSDAERMQYAQWNGTEYLYLGSGTPELRIEPSLGVIGTDGDDQVVVDVQSFELGESQGVTQYKIFRDASYGSVFYIGSLNQDPAYLLSHQFYLDTEKEKRDTFQNLVTGIVEEAIENTHKKGGFLFPFWLRYAWELYDGSVVNVSNPILMFPNVREGMYVEQKFDGSQGDENSDDSQGDEYRTFIPKFKPKFLKLGLGYSHNTLESYRDVIRSVKIYISDFVKTHDFNDNKWEFHCPLTGLTEPSFSESDPAPREEIGYYSSFSSRGMINSALNLDDGVYKLGVGYGNYQREYYSTPAPDSEPTVGFFKSYIKAPQKKDNDIKKELLEKSVFYEILEIPFEELLDNHLTYVDVKEWLEKDTLNNLTTLTQLPHDDFFSHSQIYNANLFTYNNRLNVFNFHRRAFNGFDLFAANTMQLSITGRNWDKFLFEVHIKSDDGELIVKNEHTGTSWVQGRWFFYPDPRATRAIIYVHNATSSRWEKLYDFALNEHPYLNGAYHYGELPDMVAENLQYEYRMDGVEYVTRENYYPTPQYPVNIPESQPDEYLPNTIMTSEVNNPIAFYAEGTNKFGEGTILGLATQTVALSSGTEFGRQPLILFTDRGLWSMTVSSTGLYDSINPLPREVCNNPKSITEVDGAVFFSSNKGLMVIVGSDVKCVSEQLSDKGGSPFVNYLKDSQIAYDYRDSLLWIFSDTNLIWIYNIKSGTFSQFDCTGARLSKTVPDYPDYLFQSGQNIYTLIGRPSADDDDNDYTAMFETRPMKLENALALKSIMQIRHIHQLSSDAMREFSLEIRASNDLRNWHTLTSLRGIPWKYYTFKYNFGVLYAADSFAGTVLITQERRTNKLR